MNLEILAQKNILSNEVLQNFNAKSKNWCSNVTNIGGSTIENIISN